MRFRRYTFEEICSADCEQLARMYADNLRMIQLLDCGSVLFGSFFVLLVLDLLHL